MKNIRVKFGRHSIDRYNKPTLANRKTLFSDFFSRELVNFQDSKGNIISRSFVFCNNTKEFIEPILLLSGDDSLAPEDKIGFDDRKDILKLTLSVYYPENHVPLEGLRGT